jgi:hypothetical protein
MTSMTRNSSLSKMEEMMKVRQGFSMATMGKEGGRKTMSYLGPQMWGGMRSRGAQQAHT